MNDPHVESLRYRFAVSDDRHDYSHASPWQGGLGVFDLSLEGSTLEVRVVGDFVSEAEARTALEPFLRSWELHADLAEGIPVRFVFESSHVRDRQPKGTQTVLVTAAIDLGIAGEVKVKVGHHSFPEPPPFVISQDELVRDLLEWVHQVRMGQQRLLVAVYLFQTRLLYDFSGSIPVAAAGLGIGEKILRKLGELSAVNDPTARRKVKGPERLLTQVERNWLNATLPEITLHAACAAAGHPPPQLTMSDLPSLH